MKLATYFDGSRDGQLVVVARDLASATYATGTATRLQQVLDDWNFLAPQLEALSQQLNQGRARHAFPFDPRRCMAPLPRAYHWRELRALAWPDGGLSRVTLLRAGDQAQAAHLRVELPEGVRQALPLPGLAVVTGDVDDELAGREAVEAVRLLMLTQAWVPVDQDGAVAAEVDCWSCAPVLVTPDELGPAWRGGRVQIAQDGQDEVKLQAQVRVDGRRVAAREKALPKQWPADTHFGELIAEAVRTSRLNAGTVLAWYPPLPEATPALQRAQRWRAEWFGPGETSLFGAIEQWLGEEPALAATAAAEATATVESVGPADAAPAE